MTYEDKLIRDIQDGNRSCLKELIEIYYDDIFRYCIYHMTDRETAEDAVQEIFLKVLTHIYHYKKNGKFRSYLYTIAANTCKDMWKKKIHDSEKEKKSELHEMFMESGFEQAEGQVDLIRTLSSLPDYQKEIIILRYSSDLSIKEIAKILSIPYRTAQTRLKAALRNIEKVTKRECNDE